MITRHWLLLVAVAFGCSTTTTEASPASWASAAKPAEESTPVAPPPGPGGNPPAPNPPSAGSTKAQTGTVVAEIVGFKNNQGQALVAVFCSEDGFPEHASKACAKQAAPIAKQAVTVTFAGIPAGAYAVAVHHDENKDFKMNTGLFGIPKEGYGASRDARGTFGPPKFKDAKMSLRPGATDVVPIRMTY